jgi:hypothetical protein
MKTLTLKNVILILSISIPSFFYINCDDSGTVVKQNEQYCISGKISSWTGGEKTLHAYIRSSRGGSYSIANCPINTGGNFNLCLPAEISDTTLYSSDSIFYIGCHGGTVNFNPPDVRGTEILSFKVKDGTTIAGYIKCSNYTTLYPGAYYLMYVWVNKNVTVTGSNVCLGDTLNFNGTAALGWTKVSRIYTRVGTTGGNTISYTTTEPGGAEWKYYSY